MINNIQVGPIVDHHEETLWRELIEQISKGNVIPIIGADILIDNKPNLHQIIINVLAKEVAPNKNPKSFSELISDSVTTLRLHQENLYQYVANIFENNVLPPSKSLHKLLSSKLFPFVITTSFTPIVEQIMQEVYGDELNVMEFQNNPSKNDDIRDIADLSKPTVYYMFGKVGFKKAHKFVLTDIDLLNFVSSWLSNEDNVRPKNLCNALKDKYLLMIGNTYSDWLFRFIWFSIRKYKLGNGMFTYDNDKFDEPLIAFMKTTDTLTKEGNIEVIEELLKSPELISIEKDIKFKLPQKNQDVFISYSRKDSHIAEELYKSLSDKGLSVWYDKFNLTEGCRFMDEINMAIKTAKYFIPILSSNIEIEKNEPHVYRNEWDKAIEVATSLGRTYMIPIAENGFDFYKSAIPEKMQQHNAFFYSHEDGIEDAVKAIINTINKNK